MLTLALTRTNPKSSLGPSLSNWLFPPPLELPCLGRRLPSCPSLPYLLSFHTPSLLLGFSNIALGLGLGGLEKIMGDELRPASKLWVGPIPKANIGLCFLGLTSPGWLWLRSFACWLNFMLKLIFFELFLALSFLGNAYFVLSAALYDLANCVNGTFRFPSFLFYSAILVIGSLACTWKNSDDWLVIENGCLSFILLVGFCLVTTIQSPYSSSLSSGLPLMAEMVFGASGVRVWLIGVSFCGSHIRYRHVSFLWPILPQVKQRELIPSYKMLWVVLPIVTVFSNGCSGLICTHSRAIH